MGNSDQESLQQKVIIENIRLHAEQAQVYQTLNPQVYNSHNRTRVHREIRLIMRQLHDSGISEASILDIGCGTGFLATQILNFGSCQITAVDISAEMLEILNVNIPENKKANLKIVQNEANEFVSACLNAGIRYDAVVMSALLHHLVEVEEFVKSSSQLVKPGGFYYVSYEPLKQEIDSKFRFLMHRILRNIDENLFKAYLKLKGLEPEKKGIADYQLTTGGIAPDTVIKSLNPGFKVVSVNKFCTRRLNILAVISDFVVRSQNTFSLIARKTK